MLPGGHQPRVTRLSKAIAALLVVVFAVDFFVPSTSGYLALVPGRCAWGMAAGGSKPLRCDALRAAQDAAMRMEPLYGGLRDNGRAHGELRVLFGSDMSALTQLCGRAYVSIGLAVNCVTLVLLARLVEPVYGSKEFLKFIAIVNLAAGVAVFVSVYIAFAATQNGKLLYTEFYGFQGIAAGMLVAVKQIMGDQEAKLFGVIQINIKARNAHIGRMALATHACMGKVCASAAPHVLLHKRYMQRRGRACSAPTRFNSTSRWSGLFNSNNPKHSTEAFNGRAHGSPRAQYLPILLAVLVTAAVAVLGQVHQLGFLYVGFLSAYVYLRCFQPQGDTGAKVSSCMPRHASGPDLCVNLAFRSAVRDAARLAGAVFACRGCWT
eukprot:366088-Chlamydomonas_euryale.AAC.11